MEAEAVMAAAVTEAAASEVAADSVVATVVAMEEAAAAVVAVDLEAAATKWEEEVTEGTTEETGHINRRADQHHSSPRIRPRREGSV